jgi:hypothetical protein
VRAAVGQPIFVEQRILAGHERHAVGDSGVVTALRRAHQSTEAVGQRRIAPAEVVEDRRARRVRSDRHHIAQRLVDGKQRHRIGIELAIPGIDAATDGHSTPRSRHRPQHSGVGRPRVRRPDKGFADGSPLHLVIVVADDWFLRCDVCFSERPFEE